MGELQKRVDLLQHNFGYIPYTMLMRLVEEMKKEAPRIVPVFESFHKESSTGLTFAHRYEQIPESDLINTYDVEGPEFKKWWEKWLE